MTAVYCSECGFQNPETANFCARCGALLQRAEPASDETQSLSAEDVAELSGEHDLGLEGPALVVRAGGGRAGESFRPAGARTRIGRSPD
jgi:adenine-specific DNA methylase